MHAVVVDNHTLFLFHHEYSIVGSNIDCAFEILLSVSQKCNQRLAWRQMIPTTVDSSVLEVYRDMISATIS